MKLTYIYHSGFLIEFEDKNIIFDYYKGDISNIDSEKKLYVVSTHSHRDHFNENIFDIFKGFKDVKYLLSDDIEIEEREDIHFLECRKKYYIDDLEIETFESTDLGIAVLITTEGKTIYHSGDLNWWTWHGYETQDEYDSMTERFLNEMKLLKGRKIDLAMVVLDPRQGDRYDWGLKYFIENTSTKYIAPMHLWEKYEFIDKFKADNKELIEDIEIIDTHKTTANHYEI
ncbi:MBL fold metallo-hydrolase [Peptostreptococcus porci]|uniref:MBL fold metallo-hydrolase n=1 Tax=Peptostreptococcus porci TaxID=2652282 RepID=UPI0023F4B0F4|nr:MBL fold metallo-hydrolase [Peptostreptococcus porci]MDD7183022.1 MBL fold metallo-hydrolase [Peptostreptococcus porci]MDY5964563.1 MBL fold metallo-hydrolase [Peptostreptococcus porci]